MSLTSLTKFQAWFSKDTPTLMQRRSDWLRYCRLRARQEGRHAYVFMPEGGTWSLQFEPPGAREAQPDVVLGPDGKEVAQ